MTQPAYAEQVAAHQHGCAVCRPRGTNADARHDCRPASWAVCGPGHSGHRGGHDDDVHGHVRLVQGAGGRGPHRQGWPLQVQRRLVAALTRPGQPPVLVCRPTAWPGSGQSSGANDFITRPGCWMLDAAHSSLWHAETCRARRPLGTGLLNSTRHVRQPCRLLQPGQLPLFVDAVDGLTQLEAPGAGIHPVVVWLAPPSQQSSICISQRTCLALSQGQQSQVTPSWQSHLRNAPPHPRPARPPWCRTVHRTPGGTPGQDLRGQSGGPCAACPGRAP